MLLFEGRQLRWGRLGVLLRSEEGQQVGVDLIWFGVLRRQQGGVCDGNDLVVITMHHEGRTMDLPEITGVSVSEQALMPL